MKSELLKKLEEIKEKNCVDTDLIFNHIDKLESKIDSLERDKENLKDELIIIQEEMDSKSEGFFYPDGFGSNIVMDSALETLFNNLANVPPVELENFANKYAV